MKNLILAIVFTVFSGIGIAQSGWNSGSYYAYQGTAVQECGYSYNKYDYYGNWIGVYQTCRNLYWEQVYYAGYVNYWNYDTGQWYSQWCEGYYWTCYWSGWYEVRVY